MNIINLGSNGNEIMIKITDVSGVVRYFLTSKGIKYAEHEKPSNLVDITCPKISDKLDNYRLLSREYFEYIYSSFDYYYSLLGKDISPKKATYIRPLAVVSDITIKVSREKLMDITRTLLYKNKMNVPEFTQLGELLKDFIYKRYRVMLLDLEESKDDCFSEIDMIYEKGSYYKSNDLDNVRLLNDINLSNSNRLCVYYFMQRFGMSFKDASDNADRFFINNNGDKSEVVSKILNSDERRLLKLFNYNFEFPLSLFAAKEMVNQGTDNLILPGIENIQATRYYVPSGVDEDLYKKIYSTNREIIKYFSENGVSDVNLIYLYMNGLAVNSLLNNNGEEMRALSNWAGCYKSLDEVRNTYLQMEKIIRYYNKLIANEFGPACENEGYCKDKRICDNIYRKDISDDSGYVYVLK